MSDNEFAPDTPERYQQDEVLNQGTQQDAPAPEPEDMADEPAASETPVPPAPAPTPAPEPTPAAPAAAKSDLDIRREVIPGIKDSGDTSLEGVALRTKEKLAKEPKVRMMIPLDPGEKIGAYRTVIINGYRFDVKKNVMVDLPQSVAALLADAYRITSEVLEQHPTNLNNADAEKRRALGI